MSIVEIRNLKKTYRKARRPALDGLDLEVEEGALYAFVGPNGAGKTTTLRILATLLAFDEGEVRVGGYRVDRAPRDVRRLLGYIPDEFGLYQEMPAREYLAFFAACYGIASEQRVRMIDDLLDLVGLSHRAGDPVRTLSRGMRQRLGLARALVHDPALIVADEPAAGLDPRARVELREILRALQEMGKTVFLSSHVLRELDDIATHVGIIEEGQLVTSGPVEEIRERLRPQRRVLITLLERTDDAQAWLARHVGVEGVEVMTTNGTAALRVSLFGKEEAVVGLLAELVEAGFPVRSYIEERETLESLFLNLTRGIVS